MDEEFRSHLAMRMADLERQGISSREAERQARIEFGGYQNYKEECRETLGTRLLQELWQDLRYGLRQLRRNPGFTTVAVLTLALGIGANTAIFSLIDAVMLRSLPVREPSNLVLFRWNAHQGPNGEYSAFGDCAGSYAGPSGCSFPLPIFEKIRADVQAFSGVLSFAGPAQLDLGENGPPRMADGELISGNYFSLLGVKTAVGRTIGIGDDSPEASPVVVLSYAYWQNAFGGERSVVGRAITLNNVPFTIVGVADAKFTSLSPGKTQDFWLPIAMLPRLGINWGGNIHSLSNWWLVILARLKPGVSLMQAQAAANLSFRNEAFYGPKPSFKVRDDPTVTLVPAEQGLTGTQDDYSTSLYLLMFGVGFILLIACANVAGLLLSRAAARHKETAVRMALGAGRARVLRQLLTESVILSAAGGALGVFFAYWGVHAFIALAAGNASKPFPFAIGPDWRVLLFTLAASLLTGILFGLAPAVQAIQVDLVPGLKQDTPAGAAGTKRARSRFHLGNVLVVAQVGLSMVILIGAGLFVRTLENLRAVNPGYDTQNLLLFSVDPTLAGYKEVQIQNLYRNLQARLATLPGVLSASYSSDALLTGSLWTNGGIHVEGQPKGKTVRSDMLAASPTFFQTLHIPLLEGRTFTSEDFEQAVEATAAPKGSEQPAVSRAATPRPVSPVPAAPISVLVNREFARSYLANQNPLGKMITELHADETQSGEGVPVGKPKSRRWQIVGVVGDTKYENLRRDIHPCIYIPLTGGGAHFELRTAVDPTSLVRLVRDAVSQVDNSLPLFDVHTQSQKIDELLAQQRLIARLSAFFGAIATLLACIGLFGLLSYEVVRRTNEIGIRMALGQRRVIFSDW